LHVVRDYLKPASPDLEDPGLDRERFGDVAILGVGFHRFLPMFSAIAVVAMANTAVNTVTNTAARCTAVPPLEDGRAYA